MPEEQKEQTCKILYRIVYHQSMPFPVSQIDTATGYGGCDAILVHSILHQPDGGRSELTASLDGDTGKPLTDNELFKCLVTLAHQLSESTEPGFVGRKEFCKGIFEAVRDAVLPGKKSD